MSENVKKMIAARRKNPEEMNVILALFGNGEWAETGGRLRAACSAGLPWQISLFFPSGFMN